MLGLGSGIFYAAIAFPNDEKLNDIQIWCVIFPKQLMWLMGTLK